MFEQEKILAKSKEIAKDFWTINSLINKNKKLEDFYLKNENDWINGAIQLRKDFPKETNLFIANIYRSNFSFKLALDRLQLLRKKQRFTISDKIQIIKSAFENSYHHFAFITICSNYSKDYIKSLFKDWYIPDIARERTEDTTLNAWKNKQGDIISGKKWILSNCPLFQFSPIQIDLIQLIKNADSHEKLVITQKELIVLDQRKTVTIKMKDFNALFKYLHYTINLAFQFNIKLAVKYNFWISPAIILTNPQRFGYKLKKLPDVPKSISRDRKKTNKSKSKMTLEDLEYLIALGYSLFQFVFGDMWEKILNDEKEINDFLNHYELKFNKEKFNDFHIEALKSLVEILVNLNDIIKESVLKEQFDKPSVTIDLTDIQKIDLEPFISDFEKTITKVYATKSQDIKKHFKILFITALIFSLLPPLGRINESLKYIVIEK